MCGGGGGEVKFKVCNIYFGWGFLKGLENGGFFLVWISKLGK